MAARSDSTGSPPRQIKSEKENGMAKIEDWHREAKDAIIALFTKDGGCCDDPKCECDHHEKIAQLIADHTPASTAPKEVIEKYAKIVCSYTDDQYATDDEITDILTRFASEIRVDAEIVCLCGSTRFTAQMMVKQWELTKQGKIVVSWCALPDDYFEGDDKTHIGDQEGVKEIVDEVHKRKIDLCNSVFVLNVGGYIGDSTKSEVAYAYKHGKPIEWMEPQYAESNLAAALKAAGGEGWTCPDCHSKRLRTDTACPCGAIIVPAPAPGTVEKYRVYGFNSLMGGWDKTKPHGMQVWSRKPIGEVVATRHGSTPTQCIEIVHNGKSEIFSPKQYEWIVEHLTSAGVWERKNDE